ncbi:hypothetical protein RR48_13032 [Papilio machaon]|uniref:Uncharacterized protein n=1 Tax=Papilio machaon TaxID=76193 RepID=A0A194QRZ7_PAPMA|nr:hypothetical protein RR48_13032 [Papilio machaon]
MAGIKQVRNRKLLPDLRKEGHLSKDIVLSTTEKHGVPAGSRLFSHHTLASVRKLSFYHPFSIPEDSLDIILAATYDHSYEHFADKEDLYLQPETRGCETWRRLRNTVGKPPKPKIPLVSFLSLARVTELHFHFTGFLDVDPAKKAKRVQSWYLYEQYKSLEKNQIDGAQVLRDRSCQEKILHKELEERRARRHFCNQLGSCNSDGRMQSCMGSDAGTLTSLSTDDFIDNFCGFQESSETIVNSDQTYDLSNDNNTAVTYQETSNTLEKEIETNSDLTTELKVVKQNIEDSVNMQLEAMKENIQCLEKYAKQSFVDKAEEPIVKSLKHCTGYKSAEYDNSLLAIWSGLVSFAYQVMRLNRGDILQPYVSPIKFESDELNSGNIDYNKKHYTPSHNSKETPTSSTIKEHIKLINIGRRNRRNVRHKIKDDNHACNCLPIVETFSPRIRIFNSSTTNRWLGENNPPKRSCSQNCNCRRVKKVVNPMIKLSRYIDSVLKDLED